MERVNGLWNPYRPDSPFYPVYTKENPVPHQFGYGSGNGPFPAPYGYGPTDQPFLSVSEGGIEPIMENPLHPIYSDPFFPYTGVNATMPVPGRPQGGNLLIQAFKTEDGTIDIQKMLNTAGQLLGTLQQTGSLLKGLSHLFKG